MRMRLTVVAVMVLGLAGCGSDGGGGGQPDPQSWVGTYSLVWHCDAEPCIAASNGQPPRITTDDMATITLQSDTFPDAPPDYLLITFYPNGGSGFGMAPDGADYAALSSVDEWPSFVLTTTNEGFAGVGDYVEGGTWSVVATLTN